MHCTLWRMISSDFSTMDSVPSVRRLLATDGLRLRLVQDPATVSEALDAEVSWVHNSDLLDPSPFLVPSVVLLTTGTQIEDDGVAAWEAYVTRLVDAGVAALGFGTEVVRDGVPRGLQVAAVAQGLPLFEVPYPTPFIAVARANAEAVSARAYAERTWALGAQRALARAALAPDAVTATISTLAQQVRTWVGLFDAAGELVESASPTGVPGTVELATVAEHAAELLHRSSRAAASFEVGDHTYTLQTIGSSTSLTGVLAVALATPGHEVQAVTTSALAMLGLATGHQADLTSARLELNSGIVELLMEGDVPHAERVADAAGAPLPRPPVTLLAGEHAGGTEQVITWLAARPQRTRRGVLVARYEERTVAVISPAAAPHLAAELVRVFGGNWGSSDPCEHAGLGDAHTQARLALRRGGEGLTRFRDVAGDDLLALVDDDGVKAAAAAALAPLHAHDERHGTDLAHTLRVWLEHDGRHEDTARVLAVHRHTVRARIRTAERVLGRSLSGFEARAQLWAALRITED